MHEAMRVAVRVVDFINLASMLILPAAGLGWLCLRNRSDSTLRQHTPTTFFEVPYAPIAGQLVTAQTEPAKTRQTKKVVPITAAKTHSR